jgi:hypothetical protein
MNLSSLSPRLQFSPKKRSAVSYSRAVSKSVSDDDGSDGARSGDHIPHGFGVPDPQGAVTEPGKNYQIRMRTAHIRASIFRSREDRDGGAASSLSLKQPGT